MVSEDTVRRLALALPDATEHDHHGFPSFRVHGKVFATLPAADRLRAMSDEHDIRSAAANHPNCCSEYFWGKRLACVEIRLDQADADLVHELLTEAWNHKQ
jgi:hypothetical protein